VGVVYDVANAVYAREDPVEGLRQAAPRLHLIHLSDTPLESWRHDAVGTGVVPFERIGRAVRELGCPVPLVLEVISPEPDRDFPASIAELARLGW
jgi:sugar phosphate isomerase/epimerase